MSLPPPSPVHTSPAELARDSLHQTKRFTVERGIISPVHDSYGKKVISLAIPRLLSKCWSPIHLPFWSCMPAHPIYTCIVYQTRPCSSTHVKYKQRGRSSSIDYIISLVPRLLPAFCYFTQNARGPGMGNRVRDVIHVGRERRFCGRGKSKVTEILSAVDTSSPWVSSKRWQ